MKVLLVLISLAAASLAPVVTSSPASAVGETCDGVPATIVGTPGATITGTEAGDVIVSNGAAEVDALGGDDVICTTATVGNVNVAAGPGADVVDRRGDTDPTAVGQIDPGEGPDQVFGAPGGDGVTLDDADQDLVSTGAGDDRVDSGLDSTDPSVQVDVLDLGAGDDELDLISHASAALLTVVAGDGEDYLEASLDGGRRWVVDAAAGQIRHDGVLMAGIADFERYHVATGGHFRFVGTDLPEELSADLGNLTRADLAGGSDRLKVRWFQRPADTTARVALSGGAGKDFVWIRDILQRERYLSLDLRRNSVRAGASMRGHVHGFEDAKLIGSDVSFVGNGRDNTVLIRSVCGATARGLGGADDLELTGPHDSACPHGGLRTADGGPGDDELTGSAFADRLIGGPGRDTADGRGGADRCVSVEVRTDC
jgi:Ca2+-binding RTX toxin-like protein